MRTISTVLVFMAMLSLSISCNSKKEKEMNNTNIELEQDTLLNRVTQLVTDSSAVVIDVRTPEEFAEGHITNSVNIPLDIIMQDSLVGFGQYDNIVVVCRSGNRSEQAKKILNYNGYTNVYNAGGWDTFNAYLEKQ